MKIFKAIKFLFFALIFTADVLQAQTPIITSFSPASGSVGTLVTIVGKNLGKPTAFTIGGVHAIVVSDTSILVSNYGDTLVGLVMPGTVTGIISVKTGNGTGTSTGNFTVTKGLVPSLQQGNKLLGTGTIGSIVYQGSSVAVSADGNTAIVGGSADNNGIGAAWVYTRSGGAWTQQGNKLIGTGAVPASVGVDQGWSVDISADGNTAIVGGFMDNNQTGAAWIFSRSGGIWTQQGNKLVGTGAMGIAEQGYAVSISADGNTAVLGGPFDDNSSTQNGGKGAVWIFTRSAGVWTQQGNKLTGTGSLGSYVSQGGSLSLSADGNTLIVGGSNDNFDSLINTSIGAAWVFFRSGGVWAQQGNKLTSAESDTAAFGCSVSLSADGNTAIIGGDLDSNFAGAAWVFIRSGGIWVQQGGKLVGTGAIGTGAGAQQGSSVSISADGNTAAVGGNGDDGFTGAVWIYGRSAGVWAQQGSKLTGAGYIGAPVQGSSVSISSDGSTLIEAGYQDNNNAGAAWVFAPSCSGPTIPTLSTPNPLICNGQSATLNIQAGTLNGATAWQWFSDSCGGKSAGSGTVIHVTPGSTTTYYARGEGCGIPGSCGSIAVAVTPLPAIPAICSVTVDSLSKYNSIMWAKPVSSSIKSFLIYRDTANNAYGKIGEVPYSALSLFTDTTRLLFAANGDPNLSSWRYKIAVKDTCGTISASSPYHETLFMQNNTGNFIWNNYLIEGQSVPIPELSNYLFQRDDLSNGNFKTIATLSASSTAYTDPQYTTYKSTASWRAITAWSITCTPAARMEASYSTTKSNVKTSGMAAGIENQSFIQSVNIYPNPARNEFNLEFFAGYKKYQIKIYNLLGEIVYIKEISDSYAGNFKYTEKIDVSGFDAGVYSLSIQTETLKVFKKFIIQ